MTPLRLGCAVLGILAALAGEPMANGLPSSRRALIITQAGDVTNLQWLTERGLYYTLMYTDSQYNVGSQGRARWQPLPGYIRRPGTGRQETASFQTNPIRPRRYSLVVETEEQVRKSRTPVSSGR